MFLKKGGKSNFNYNQINTYRLPYDPPYLPLSRTKMVIPIHTNAIQDIMLQNIDVIIRFGYKIHHKQCCITRMKH